MGSRDPLVESPLMGVSARELYTNVFYGIDRQMMKPMGPSLGGADPLRAEVESLKYQLRTYVEFAERVRKGAMPYGTVLRGAKFGKVVISVAGKTIEVGAPNCAKLKPGDTVRVQSDTFQIVDAVEDVTSSGEIVVVQDVFDGAVEVERGGSPRRVGCGIAVKRGERVVLDPSASVVVANLGKPRTGFLVPEDTGVTWDDIGGLEDAKRQMREAIEAPILHAAKFKRYGAKPIKGVLLYGSPGCGKTLIAKAAAAAMARLHGKTGAGAFLYVKGPEVLDMYVGNSEGKVRALFVQAREHKREHGYPAIICIDEADAILGKRGTSTGSSLSSTLVPAFLAEMDGLEDSGAIVILATNRPDTLDPAIVRDGRIDRRIRVGRPTQEAALAILTSRLGPELAHAATAALFDRRHHLYEVAMLGEPLPVAMVLSDFISGAMVSGLADRAMRFAMQREIESGVETTVSIKDVESAVLETLEQLSAVNHEDEIAEFCNGRGRQLLAVHKGRLVIDRPATEANRLN